MGRRLGKSKVEAKGIFRGGQVMRGPDWDWGNQDGGERSVGQVLEVRGWETESFRSVACVMWKPTSTNVYRVGHKGKVCLLMKDEQWKMVYCFMRLYLVFLTQGWIK